MNKKKRIHKDKNGRDFIKEPYFIGGKMKFNRIYVSDGISIDEFYEKNASDLDFFINGDYHLMTSENESDNQGGGQIGERVDLPNNEDLPF